MIFEAITYKSAGPINFGDSIATARKKLSVPHHSFRRTPEMQIPCDYFEVLGAFVYYKYPGEVEAVEFASPARVLFDGISLFEMPYQWLKTHFEKIDQDAEIEDASLISFKHGISLYAPDCDEDRNATVESVTVFAEGYYD